MEIIISHLVPGSAELQVEATEKGSLFQGEILCLATIDIINIEGKGHIPYYSMPLLLLLKLLDNPVFKTHL